MRLIALLSGHIREHDQGLADVIVLLDLNEASITDHHGGFFVLQGVSRQVILFDVRSKAVALHKNLSSDIDQQGTPQKSCYANGSTEGIAYLFITWIKCKTPSCLRTRVRLTGIQEVIVGLCYIWRMGAVTDPNDTQDPSVSLILFPHPAAVVEQGSAEGL
jgi:hypothetical protein